MRTTESPFWRRILRSATLRLFHAVENNGCATFGRNGEAWLLQKLCKTWSSSSGPRVVFDVGANQGDYTAAVLAAASESDIDVNVHAFEPSAPCAAALQQRFADTAKVHVNPTALSDAPGSVRLRADTTGSTHASLIERPGIPDNFGTWVNVIRLDDYIGKSAVHRIDLLKLDVEGAELAVLRGLGKWLNPDCVALIQFEYGGTTLDARTSLREINALLESRGYDLAKLLPRALERRRYAPWMDHFTYANYVALGTPSTEAALNC